MQILSVGEHNGKGICRCAGEKDRNGAYTKTNPECPAKFLPGWVESIAFDADGKRVVMGSEDGHVVQIWEVETGAEVSRCVVVR